MCSIWAMVSSWMPGLNITSHAHRIGPLPSLLRYPASHSAYLLAVHCFCRRQASNSASVRLGRNTFHAASKPARAVSNSRA
jgi:hypothetical protein